MNEKINLCEILKDCPKGTKLYSPLFGEVAFCGIEENEVWPIRVKFHNDDLAVKSLFIKDGRHYNYPHGECLLFPSKDQQDWSKWKCPKLKKPKFDPKTLKPFDRVLVSEDGYEDAFWASAIFSHFNQILLAYCGSNFYSQVIPYNEETKHLVGTSDEAPEYYRYWED